MNAPETLPALSRAQRRELARLQRRAASAKPARRVISRNDLKMRTIPWNTHAVWAPLDQIMDRMEIDGTVETAQGRPVLYDAGSGGWYEIAPAIMGVVDFHRIAAERHGWQIDLNPLTKLAKKLEHGSPIFSRDLDAVRATAAICKRHAGELTLREAQDILRTVRIQIEMEKRGLAA